MKTVLKYALLSLCFVVNIQLFAQYNDAGLWTSVSLEKRISKKWAVALEPEVRLYNNMQRVSNIIITGGLEYRVLKHLHIGLAYRLNNKQLKTGIFSVRHRIMGDLSYKHKFGGFSAQYRSRFQSELRDYRSSETGNIPYFTWRHKLDCSYDFDSFEPYLSTELFLQLSNPEEPDMNGKLTTIRYCAGCDYKIMKRNWVGLYYLIQNEVNCVNPCTSYILGLKYKVEIR